MCLHLKASPSDLLSSQGFFAHENKTCFCNNFRPLPNMVLLSENTHRILGLVQNNNQIKMCNISYVTEMAEWKKVLRKLCNITSGFKLVSNDNILWWIWLALPHIMMCFVFSNGSFYAWKMRRGVSKIKLWIICCDWRTCRGERYHSKVVWQRTQSDESF